MSPAAKPPIGANPRRPIAVRWNTGEMPSEARRWTVLTWNLQGTKPTDLDRVVDEIRRRAPDVMLLQEIRRPQAVELGRRLGMDHHWVFKHHAFAPLATDHAEGAAILTPHALTQRGSDVVSDSRWKRWWRRRIAVWALVERADHTAYRVVNVHLSPHDLRDQRLVEADRISAIVARWGDAPPVIVGGDMNDHREAEPLERLPGVEHVASPPTNPAVAPTNVLDHILLPSDATDVSLEVPDGGPRWDGVSDHLPVTVSFSLDWVTGLLG